MTLPLGGSQSYELHPGDQIKLVNGGAKAIRIKIVTACDTETVAGLYPGAEVQLTVGSRAARIDILDVDENYTGLRVVR